MLAVVIPAFISQAQTGADDRAFAVQTLTRIAEPVLAALADGKLKSALPAHDWERTRTNFAPLEAFGRTLAGIAPWLELGPDDSTEGKVRAHFIDLSVKSLVNATDPQSPDFLNFNKGGQPLVDTAFLALGLLRAPNQLWGKLDSQQRSNVVAALKSMREIKPDESNWLLFSATIEAALWHFTGEGNLQPIEYAVQRHEQWYLGDGTYGDGAEFHWDYYNSYVIQPMLLAVLRVCAEKNNPLGELYPKILARAQRYAVVQERLISPEGTFPVIGRSSAYRFGAFQLLADISLQRKLPAEMKARRRSLRAHRRHPPHDRGAGNVRRARLAASRRGWPPAVHPRKLYFHRQSLPLPVRPRPARFAGGRSLLDCAGGAVDAEKNWSGTDVPADHAYSDKK